MTNATTLAPRLGCFVRPDSPTITKADILRAIAIGSLTVVNHHIMQMYQLGYAQPHEWSRPLPTANPNEVMRIMPQRLVVGDR